MNRLTGFGLILSLAGNGIIGWFAYSDHQRVNRLVYDVKHDLGDPDKTRIATHLRPATDKDPADKSVSCSMYGENGYTNRCVPVRDSSWQVVERLDGRINELEAHLGYWSEADVTFYGSWEHQVILNELIKGWKAENDPDNDGTWNYGQNVDQCPNDKGPNWRGVTGCDQTGLLLNSNPDLAPVLDPTKHGDDQPYPVEFKGAPILDGGDENGKGTVTCTAKNNDDGTAIVDIDGCAEKG